MTDRPVRSPPSTSSSVLLISPCPRPCQSPSRSGSNTLRSSLTFNSLLTIRMPMHSSKSRRRSLHMRNRCTHSQHNRHTHSQHNPHTRNLRNRRHTLSRRRRPSHGSSRRRPNKMQQQQEGWQVCVACQIVTPYRCSNCRVTPFEYACACVLRVCLIRVCLILICRPLPTAFSSRPSRTRRLRCPEGDDDQEAGDKLAKHAHLRAA
jgi:hypothetical protein